MADQLHRTGLGRVREHRRAHRCVRCPADSLRDRAPRACLVDGAAAWDLEGAEPVPLVPTTGTGVAGSCRDGVAPSAGAGIRAPPALHDPAERTHAQSADSVDAEVLYPTPDLGRHRPAGDADLKIALAGRTTTGSPASGPSPDRLIGLAKLPTTPSRTPNRTRALRTNSACEGRSSTPGRAGLRRVIRPTNRSGRSSTSNGGSRSASTTPSARSPIRPAHMDRPGDEAADGQTPLPMVAAGVFDRFPDVRMVLAHGDAGWAFHWMEFFDIKLPASPSPGRLRAQDPEPFPASTSASTSGSPSIRTAQR